MSIILRTHGGLGNQIFQIFFARLLAEKHKLPLKELHDASYYHGFTRSAALRVTGRAPTPLEKIISDIRVPKILSKVNVFREKPFWFFGSAYLDSYFQERESYASFTDEAIARQLRVMATELCVDPAFKNQNLIHLRLGDFFKSSQGAREHALIRLENAADHSAIMTNDENLMRDPKIASILEAKYCEIVSTNGMAAEDILRLMAQYHCIDANDSTLVFWASVLGGCQTRFDNRRLESTHAYFTRVFQP